MCAMGSCIKVVNKKIWFPSEKKKLSPVDILNQNRKFSVIICKKRGHFSVMCIAQNIISLRSNKSAKMNLQKT
jgi:hypothetical protein